MRVPKVGIVGKDIHEHDRVCTKLLAEAIVPHNRQLIDIVNTRRHAIRARGVDQRRRERCEEQSANEQPFGRAIEAVVAWDGGRQRGEQGGHPERLARTEQFKRRGDGCRLGCDEIIRFDDLPSSEGDCMVVAELMAVDGDDHIVHAQKRPAGLVRTRAVAADRGDCTHGCDRHAACVLRHAQPFAQRQALQMLVAVGHLRRETNGTTGQEDLACGAGQMRGVRTAERAPPGRHRRRPRLSQHSLEKW